MNLKCSSNVTQSNKALFIEKHRKWKRHEISQIKCSAKAQCDESQLIIPRDKETTKDDSDDALFVLYPFVTKRAKMPRIEIGLF